MKKIFIVNFSQKIADEKFIVIPGLTPKSKNYEADMDSGLRRNDSHRTFNQRSSARYF